MDKMASYGRYAAFACVMLAISMLPGYYVFYHIVDFFGLSLGYLFWAGVLVLALLFMGGMGLAAINDDPRLKFLNIGLGIWVGFFLIFMFLLFFLDIATVFYVWPDYRLAGKALMALAAAVAVAGAVNARFVRTRRVKVPAGRLKGKLRVVQLSDLHLGPVNGLDYLKKMVERTNAEKPDLVVMTGDFIDGRLTDELFAPINDIKAPVFFCVGNHEHYVGLEDMLRFLGRTKAKLLINEKVDMGEYELAGIDFDWNSRNFDGMVEKVRPSGAKYAVLMSHGPPAFDAARKAGFDLTLSGHTHGGQFSPFVGFGRLFVKYRQGMYSRDGKYLYVTPGTGTWGPPLRMGTSSELTVVDIG